MSANRILVHSGVATDFRDRFCRKVFDLTNGDPAEAATVIGPLINARQVAAVEKKVDDAVAAGAKALVRGETVGNVMAPVVLENVDRESAIAHDELFGPVVLLMEFGDDQEAIDIANDTDFGLSGAVHTRDISRGIRIARQNPHRHGPRQRRHPRRRAHRGIRWREAFGDRTTERPVQHRRADHPSSAVNHGRRNYPCQ